MAETGQEQNDNEPDDVESYLTAEDIAAEYGVDPSSVTRAYQRGKFGEFKRVKAKRGAKQVFVYPPAGVDAAREAGALGAEVVGEGVLNGAAVNQRQANDLALRMADKLLESVTTVIASQQALTKSYETMAGAFLAQFERYDKRLAHIEDTHLEHLRAKEELLSEQLDRDLQLAQFEQSSELKQKALEALAANAPALLELATLMAKKEKEQCPPSSTSPQPPEPDGSSSEPPSPHSSEGKAG